MLSCLSGWAFFNFFMYSYVGLTRHRAALLLRDAHMLVAGVSLGVDAAACACEKGCGVR